MSPILHLKENGSQGSVCEAVPSGTTSGHAADPEHRAGNLGRCPAGHSASTVTTSWSPHDAHTSVLSKPDAGLTSSGPYRRVGGAGMSAPQGSVGQGGQYWLS